MGTLWATKTKVRFLVINAGNLTSVFNPKLVVSQFFFSLYLLAKLLFLVHLYQTVPPRRKGKEEDLNRLIAFQVVSNVQYRTVHCQSILAGLFVCVHVNQHNLRTLVCSSTACHR